MNNKKTPRQQPGQIKKDNIEFTTITAICAAITQHGICLKHADFGEKWFPKSQIQLNPGQPNKGDQVTVALPDWLLQRAKIEVKVSREIRYTDILRITGYCVKITNLAYMVFCDVDHQIRPFAKSKVELKAGGSVHQPITLLVPAWTVKKADKSFPPWVMEVKHDA